jgi:outer membrane biosynthesis protein TonB
MSLFKKKLSLEDIIAGIEALSPEEREALEKRMNAPESNEEQSEAPETKEQEAPTEAPAAEAEPEAAEAPEATEQTPEAPEETPAEPAAEAPETEEEREEPTPTEEPVPEAPAEDAQEQDNVAEMIKGLTDKVNSLEATVATLSELKAKMDEYVSKQRESFGYESHTHGKPDDYENMSAAELKEKILKG